MDTLARGCMFYRYTQDPELKAILRATVADLLETERSNGSISCVPVGEQPGDKKGDLWERKYVMLALEEYYEQVEADSAVLGSLKRQADCILSQIGPAPKREITDLGWSDNHIESSTLLEPIMRLYKWTGEARYLDFARYIVESVGCQGYNLFQQTLDGVPPYQMGGTYPKAYEMLSLFEGVVEYYRCTGEERWLQVALQLYQAVCRYELTIIGSGGGDQPHHPKVLGEAWDHTAVEQTNPDMSRMMETCVGVTWMKYCSQLLRLTGDVSAADRIETYLYNGLLGAMKPTGVRMQPTIAPYRWWPTPAGWWPSRRSLRCCPAAAWSLRCPPPMAPSA
ncbi:MAG: beta-L-arabinofuranosidase domain-containing protein [Bacteroides sp.]